MTFFLTSIDPNAKTKGSRDPLGTLSVWTGFGRQVVGNLTTQTTSFDDFRVLVIGAWLEDQVGGELPFAGDAFLVWEQLAAYARLEVNGTGDFRGVNRATRYLADGPRVSAEREWQLLNNQRAYGIWGLYRAAAWRCGLLQREGALVQGKTLALVEDLYLPRLRQAWGHGELEDWARKGQTLDVRRHRSRLEAIAACVTGNLDDRETELFRDTLVYGGTLPADVARCQRELADALAGLDPDATVEAREVLRIAAATESVLAERLRDVLACEALVAPAAMCFSFVSRQPQAPLAQVVDNLAQHFSDADGLLSTPMMTRLEEIGRTRPERLRTFPAEGDGPDGGDRWLRIARHLHAKEFEPLVRLLLQQNELVSRSRGGSSGWVRISQAGTLDVQLSDANYDLWPPDETDQLWINPYFLDNLRHVARRVLVAT